jgi:hypothetical protein
MMDEQKVIPIVLQRYAGTHCPDSCYECKYHGKCQDEAEMDDEVE